MKNYGQGKSTGLVQGAIDTSTIFCSDGIHPSQKEQECLKSPHQHEFFTLSHPGAYFTTHQPFLCPEYHSTSAIKDILGHLGRPSTWVRIPS